MRGVGSIDCERCIELMDEYFDGGLDESARAALETHVRACEACASFFKKYRQYMEEMSPFRAQQEPPAAFHEGWVRAVAQQRQRRKRARFRIQMASAAAALLLLLGVGFFFSLNYGGLGNVMATAPVAAGEGKEAVTRLSTTGPGTDTEGLVLQATAADQAVVKGAGGAADTGVPASAGLAAVVLQVDDAPEAAEELRLLADKDRIDVRQVSADTYAVAVDPAARPSIEEFIAQYSNDRLPSDKTLVLTLTIRQNAASPTPVR